MTFDPDDVQQQVIDATDPVLLVLGGAGTGKTSTAAAAVRAELERQDLERSAHPSRTGRALFLSFSRAAVSQILDRSANILGSYQERVETTTYHAFAWELIQRFGNVIGQPEPQLTSAAEAKLLAPGSKILYKDLLPLAMRICQVPAVAQHLRTRWSIIVCDEFQDTDRRQFQLLTTICGSARLLLLGDLNQCIYRTLPGVVGVGPERVADALALDGARQIDLLPASHRDPTGVLPAAAEAIRRRDFGHEALSTAIRDRRLRIHADLGPDEEADLVASHVQQLLDEGHLSVAVFSHHIDSTTELSDQLRDLDIDHEIVGLPESLTAALHAQHAMIAFAVDGSGWDRVRYRLAVFVTSSVRGERVPPLAYQILRATPGILARRLDSLYDQLRQADPQDALLLAAQAHRGIGLPRGQRHWDRAAQLLRPLMAQSLRRAPDNAGALKLLDQAVTERGVSLLTCETDGANAETPVQLMGLYQAKGREADATVVVLRDRDFFGTEPPPYLDGSRLLYVVLTRARHTTVVLLFGSPPHLVAPLRGLSRFERPGQ
ncbi:UvrD-helicase domain-containing protein [Streptomyces sp. NPDC054796]